MYAFFFASASPGKRTQAEGQEDRHRVVVGFGSKLAGRRGDDILEHAAREEYSAICLICESPWPPARSARLGDHLCLTERGTPARGFCRNGTLATVISRLLSEKLLTG